MTHICVSKLTVIGSDNGLPPGRRQAIIWTNAQILLIGPLGTNFNEILIEIYTFSFKKLDLKMSSAKWCPFCLGLRVSIGDTQVADNTAHMHCRIGSSLNKMRVYCQIDTKPLCASMLTCHQSDQNKCHLIKLWENSHNGYTPTNLSAQKTPLGVMIIRTQIHWKKWIKRILGLFSVSCLE